MKSLTESINALLQQHKHAHEKGESSTVSKAMHKEPEPTETFNDNHWEVNRGVKLDVPDFYGDHNIDVFLDWVHSLESFFRWHNMNEARKVYFAEAKLRGTARVWWKKEQANFRRAGRGDIQTWAEMKLAMEQHFLPNNYKQRNHILFMNLGQDNLSVEEYSRKFYHLCTRCEFDDDEVLVAMYRKGLNFRIANKISGNLYVTLSDIVQAAYQVEEELSTQSVKRPFMSNYNQRENGSSNHPSGVVDKSQNGPSSFSNRNSGSFSYNNRGNDSSTFTHGSSSSNNQGRSSPPRQNFNNRSNNFNNKPRTDITCGTCGGRGHFSAHCPNRLVTFAEKLVAPEPRGDALVCLEAEKEDNHERSDDENDDDGHSLLVRPLFTTRRDEEKEDWRRNSLFQTRVRCNDRLCSLIIDSGSCTNVVSEDAVRKLGLKTEPHPNPYKVAWVNNTNLKVHEKCLVTYSIGRLVDTVECDVLPVKVCHILLGRPWLFDKKVQHCGYNNTYSFKHGGYELKLMPAKDPAPLKLKHAAAGSFLLKRLPIEDGILGSGPNSRTSPFQQGRTDAGQAQRTRPTWLDQYYFWWNRNSNK